MRLTWMALALVGCGQTHTYQIAAHKEPCFGESMQLCMLVDKGEGEELHYSGIREFDFEWGVEVEARVRESPVSNPPADGSSIRYKLVEILEESAVEPGTTFVWSYDSYQVRPGYGDPWIDVESETLFDGTPFTCANAQTCAAVQTSYEEGTEIDVTFAFDAAAGIQLVDAVVAEGDS